MKQTKEIAPFVKSYGVNKFTSLKPIDTLVYAFIYSHLNQKTKRCNPSIETLSKEIGINKRTILNSIKRLQNSKLIVITQSQKGNKINNEYYLPEYNDFAMIPKDFLYSPEYDPKLKAFTIAFRNLCFNDTFRCKHDDVEIYNLLGITPKTYNKYMQDLQSNDIVKYNKRNKAYQLDVNTINWRLDKIEKDIKEIKETKADKKEIQELKEIIAKQQDQIQLLLNLHSN